MKPAAFAPAARDEFDAAVEWYEASSPGLGEEFVNCIAELMDRIGDSPSGFPRWDQDPRFRKVVAQRFPYVVFYRELSERVEVVAVAHGAREPGYWLGRK